MIRTLNTPTGEVIYNEGAQAFGSLGTTSDVVTDWWYVPSVKCLNIAYNGRQYWYFGVPYEVAVGMLFTDSLGRYVNTEVKGKYEYRGDE